MPMMKRRVTPPRPPLYIVTMPRWWTSSPKNLAYVFVTMTLSCELVSSRYCTLMLQVSPSEVHDFELCLYDTQPSAIGGIFDEFIASPRLDNLMMSFCSTRALIDR